MSEVIKFKKQYLMRDCVNGLNSKGFVHGCAENDDGTETLVELIYGNEFILWNRNQIPENMVTHTITSPNEWLYLILTL